MGCDTPSQSPVWVDGDDEYYNCPLKFIPWSVVDWYTELVWMKEMGGYLPYQKVSARWHAAWTHYTAAYNAFSEQKREIEKQRSDGLGKLRRSWHKK